MNEATFFYVFGAMAVVSALAMVLNLRNTVAAALSLVVTMISLGAIYAVLEAHLIAVLQIMVYAGAIVVVFLFVVMLLNLRHDSFGVARQRLVKLVGVGLGAWLLVRFLQLLPGLFPQSATLPEGFGGYRAVGTVLFTDYVLAFETAGLLLLAAIVGAVVLAKRRLD